MKLTKLLIKLVMLCRQYEQKVYRTPDMDESIEYYRNRKILKILRRHNDGQEDEQTSKNFSHTNNEF